MAIELLTPIFQQGNVRNIHFFNGRLLTAEDLRDEQLANRRQRQQLGQASGPGVVYGLQVTKAQPKNGVPHVSVKLGLALNQVGQVMQLPETIEVALAHDSSAVGGAGIFADCDEAPVTDAIQGQTSVYVLTISPASSFEGRVPMHELSDNGVMTGCGRRYAVEGVKFNLVGLYVNNLRDLSQKTKNQLSQLMMSDTDNIPRLSRLRNILSHICLGTEDAAKYGEDPFARPGGVSAYSLYGTHKAVQMTGCEVPLALIHITSKGIRFIDMWAVRRRPTSIPPAWHWPLSAGSRRLAENEAAFLQFQAQLDWLILEQLSAASAALIRAKDYFRFIPAAGLLREAEEGSRGINLEAFFTEVPYRKAIFVDGARLNAVLDRSFFFDSIDLAHEKGLAIYRTWQNQKAVDDGIAVSPFVIYTSLHMSLLESARYDEGRWDYGNFT